MEERIDIHYRELANSMEHINRSPWQHGKSATTNDHRLLLNLWNTHQVEGLNFFYNFEDIVSNVYIIDGPNNASTIKSCELFKLAHKVYPSFNLKTKLGTDIKLNIKNIISTVEHKTQIWSDHVKLMNHNLTYEEVTRILDHMVLWNEISKEGKPTIILESGATLFKPVKGIIPRNSILSLDGSFNWHNNNYICMDTVHAYVVDQFSSIALLNEVLINGIIEPLELMFRIDKFNIMLKQSAARLTNLVG